MNHIECMHIHTVLTIQSIYVCGSSHSVNLSNFLCVSLGGGEKDPENKHILLGNPASMDQVMMGASEALGVVSQNTRSRLQTIFAIDFAGTSLSPEHMLICVLMYF